MTEYIGYTMVATPFIALFCFIAKDSFKAAVLIFTGSTALFLWIIVALELIN